VHAEQSSREQDRHPVGHPLELAEDVGGDHDGARARQGPNLPAHLDDLARVEAVGGLVENQEVRIAQQGLGDSDALAVATRKLADEETLDVAQRT
jgi:hypothetical protein